MLLSYVYVAESPPFLERAAHSVYRMFSLQDSGSDCNSHCLSFNMRFEPHTECFEPHWKLTMGLVYCKTALSIQL